jgi:hypothetical protein
MTLRAVSAAEPPALTEELRPAPARMASAGSTLPVLLLGGIAAWILGVEQIQRSQIGFYGLLGTGDVLFVVGFALIVAGFLLELARGKPRGWLLGLHLVALLVAIHATVPILYGTPQYAWVYKHIAVTQQLGFNGQITDSTNIYQLWPALFAAAAALAGMGHTSPVTFATWAPLAFELAALLVVLGAFRAVHADRRVTWLAALLYIGLVSWIAQDYFSPQAFGYVLWFGILVIVLRWLRALPTGEPSGRLSRLRAQLLVGAQPPPATSGRMRLIAVLLAAVVYFAIVAAHQLTPYLALASLGALEILGLVRPRWLLLLLAAIAVGFLIPRYNLIAHDFGGLFSGGNPITNAGGRAGTYHAGPEQFTAWVVRALAAFMWLAALGRLVQRRQVLGRYAVPAVLAFSPFVILGVQNYGGEAIYRIFLFSCPWCALLISEAMLELRRPVRRWLLIAGVSVGCLFAGLQGLYGPVRLRAFTPAEVDASRWLFSHVPAHALVVLPDDNFPAPLGVRYNQLTVQDIPADPQIGEDTVDEGDVNKVVSWVNSLGHGNPYVVFSHSLGAYADFFGAPRGYATLASKVATSPGWSVVYRNQDSTIYHLDLTQATSVPAVGGPPSPPVRPSGQPGASQRRSGARRRAALHP